MMVKPDTSSASGPVIGLIPARGGSKGIPRKNLIPLCGKPLIQYTFEEALDSLVLDRVILSTDDAEIASLGRSLGIDVPFMRPGHLATDEASTRSVQRHLLGWLAEQEGYVPGVVVTLQPTSPLRRAEHIDQAVQEFHARGVDSVIGVTPVREHPYEVVGFVNDRMFRPVERPVGVVRRQEYPSYYHINGAIYVMRHRVILERDAGYGDRVYGYEMLPASSVDIDTTFDLQLAACLLQQSS